MNSKQSLLYILPTCGLTQASWRGEFLWIFTTPWCPWTGHATTWSGVSPAWPKSWKVSSLAWNYETQSIPGRNFLYLKYRHATPFGGDGTMSPKNISVCSPIQQMFKFTTNPDQMNIWKLNKSELYKYTEELKKVNVNTRFQCEFIVTVGGTFTLNPLNSKYYIL